MNTSTIATIKDAIIATLLLDKPSLKISDKLDDALAEAIREACPALTVANKLTDDQRKIINDIVSFSAGVMLDTLSDDILLHIPECQKADKTGIDALAPVIPAQSITIKLDNYTNNSVRFFALALNSVWSRLNFDKEQAELDNLHRYKLVSEALPILFGEQVIKSFKSGVDYSAKIAELGLTPFASFADSYIDGMKGVGLIINVLPENLPSVMSLLTKDKDKKGLWYYTNTSGQKLTVTRAPRIVTDEVTELDTIVGYGFTFKPAN